MIPSKLTQNEFAELTNSIIEFHTYQLCLGRCSSLLAQRIKSPPETVWSVVRRLDLLDDDRRVTGFTITGGEHRLRIYKSVTTVHGFERDGRIWSVVLESYVVDVPEGNTEEDTRFFADTVVKLNLQKLASVAPKKYS